MPIDELLFDASTTHVEVRCWQCSHLVILKREQVPANLERHEFERRAVCSQCQATWPQTMKFPRRKPTSM